ncbi:hypothetical protein GCM10022206_82390 [Streptomyces chiangmaiensis]
MSTSRGEPPGIGLLGGSRVGRPLREQQVHGCIQLFQAGGGRGMGFSLTVRTQRAGWPFTAPGGTVNGLPHGAQYRITTTSQSMCWT